MNKNIMIGVLVIFFISCNEKSIQQENMPAAVFSAYSSTCLSSALGKNTAADSIFSYSFHTDLLIDFSTIANCCPDSNRFDITSSIGRDTVDIFIADTSENRCRCNCLYMHHAEFKNLINNRYTVRCILRNSQDTGRIIHQVTVNKIRTGN